MLKNIGRHHCLWHFRYSNSLPVCVFELPDPQNHGNDTSHSHITPNTEFGPLDRNISRHLGLWHFRYSNLLPVCVFELPDPQNHGNDTSHSYITPNTEFGPFGRNISRHLVLTLPVLELTSGVCF